MNTARKGSAFERVVVKDLEERGWLVTRASNSKGIADVWAVCRHEVALVEVKSNGRCDPEQWNHLYDHAIHHGCVPVLAEPVDRRREPGEARVRYWRLIGRKTPGGSQRQPREPWHADEAGRTE